VAERIGRYAGRWRRLRRLGGTGAADLRSAHIDSLELLELIQLESSLPVAVIYDLGANIGTWTALARAVFPSAQVHAFEPLPDHTTKFRQRFGSKPGVTLHQVALGAQSGEAEMDVTTYSDAASLLPLAKASQQYFGLSQGSRVRVPVTRLDDWRAANGIPPPDVIKLDLQGYEIEALRGALGTLSHVRYVISEVSFAEFYVGQPLFTDVVRFLAEQGLFLHALGYNTPLGAPLIQNDLLFSRRRSAL
jgi:FkbM family methyltransferase